MMKLRLATPWVAAALGVAAAPAFGTGAVSAQGTGASAGAMVTVERYTFDDATAIGLRSVSLLTVPFAVQPMGGRVVSATVSGAFAHGTIERADGSTTSLAGLTDTEIRIGISVSPLLMLGSSLVLPTGSARHDEKQAEVAGIIAADLLPFRVSNWGSGGGADVSLASAVKAGATAMGVRIGYQVGRGFEPLAEQSFIYRPGNQIYGRLAVDHNVGRSAKLAAHLTVQRFADDQIDGQNLYRAGDRLQLITSYAFAAGAASAVLYGGVLHRSRSVVLTNDSDRPTQDLILAGGGMRLRTALGMLAPDADLRLFRSGDGIGQGYAGGVGTGLEVRAGAGMVLVPSARVRTGRIIARADAETRLLGIDAGLAVRFGGPGR
jgi:hypothetical protein